MVVVSDAGTPGISDPGAWLAAQLAAAGETVSTVPGPSSVVGALVVSGLPTDRFCVEGFLPRKGASAGAGGGAHGATSGPPWCSRRPAGWRRRWPSWRPSTPARPVAVVRELTKLHEEVWRGSLAEAAAEFAARQRARARWCWWSAAPRPGAPAGEADVEAAVRATLADTRAPARARWPTAWRPRSACRGARSTRRRCACGLGRRPSGPADPTEGTGTLPAVPPYYLTTPIYYVNDAPHVGTAYTTVNADALARWHRLLGDDVWFMTGTDEHGAKIVEAAEANGVTPKEWTDRTSARFQEAWRRLDISNDDFIRTTEPRHYAVVQEFLQRIYDNGFIELGPYSGLYCISCEDYYTEDQLVDGNCPVHGRAVVEMQEDNYFFKLSLFEQRLLDYYDAIPTSSARRRSATRRWGSSAAACAMSPSPGRPSPGACRCPGTAGTSSTSGTTR